MRFNLLLSAILLIGSMVLPSVTRALNSLPPSTGLSIPYSVQTKNLVKHLFNNRTIMGGQVIALRDQPGRDYSANYLDIGDLAGVKAGDVFAIFTPEGDR